MIEPVKIRQPNQTIIESIEAMLAEAKDGKIKEIVAVWVDNEHRSVTSYSGDCGDTYKMLGVIEVAKLEYTEQNILRYRKTVK